MRVVKEVESEMGELGRKEAGFRVGQRSHMINWEAWRIWKLESDKEWRDQRLRRSLREHVE